MGINTGLVVVGEIGSNLRMGYTSIGDATQVCPGEKVPVDGVIVEGNSAVNESMFVISHL